jgi:hypothetical protein
LGVDVEVERGGGGGVGSKGGGGEDEDEGPEEVWPYRWIQRLCSLSAVRRPSSSEAREGMSRRRSLYNCISAVLDVSWTSLRG